MRLSAAAAGLVFLFGCASTARVDEEARALPRLAENAPEDHPFQMDSAGYAMLEPCRAKARATFPAAADRFRRGLPPDHHFFVVTVIRDDRDVREQVFVSVDTLTADRIVGRLASQPVGVRGFRNGQRLDVGYSDVVDWMVARPDGSEEGNLIGKFIDEGLATGRPPHHLCAG